MELRNWSKQPSLSLVTNSQNPERPRTAYEKSNHVESEEVKEHPAGKFSADRNSGRALCHQCCWCGSRGSWNPLLQWEVGDQRRSRSKSEFKLTTQERGRMKEEEFAKMRIPFAQGLPWTTDEPESLVKPYVKDITIPLDLKLHSDIRAEQRAEFDYQVAEKLSLIEQYRAEGEGQQKVAEEEEL